MKVEELRQQTMEANILCWLVQAITCWAGHYLECSPTPGAHRVEGMIHAHHSPVILHNVTYILLVENTADAG